MHIFRRLSIALLMIAAISSPALLSGCTGHVRYYDAEYRDYHPWNHDEIVFYGRWETETHRNHVEFSNRPANEQAEYWHWRHGQH
jgi:hypothetical protein